MSRIRAFLRTFWRARKSHPDRESLDRANPIPPPAPQLPTRSNTLKPDLSRLQNPQHSPIESAPEHLHGAHPCLGPWGLPAAIRWPSTANWGVCAVGTRGEAQAARRNAPRTRTGRTKKAADFTKARHPRGTHPLENPFHARPEKRPCAQGQRAADPPPLPPEFRQRLEFIRRNVRFRGL